MVSVPKNQDLGFKSFVEIQISKLQAFKLLEMHVSLVHPAEKVKKTEKKEDKRNNNKSAEIKPPMFMETETRVNFFKITC